MRKRIFSAWRSCFLAFSFLWGAGILHTYAADADHEDNHSEFSLSQYLFHHVLDDYAWEFLHVGSFSLKLYLPIIVYHSERGLLVFSSRRLYESPDHTYQGVQLAWTPSLHKPYLKPVEPHATLYDFSFTKIACQILAVMLLLIGIGYGVARAYARDPFRPPQTLMQRLIEPVVIFIRDDVAGGTIPPERVHKFLPYLLTMFFFILLANLMGLLPLGFNITGNFTVTLVLAAFTFFIGHIHATRTYWLHIVNTPGVPALLKFVIPIMPIVEILSIFARHLALAIRLFANIFGGHLNLLTIIGLTFLFGAVKAWAGWLTSGTITVPVGIFLFLLEILVAFIQAYVFTMLSAVFIGLASESEEHH